MTRHRFPAPLALLALLGAFTAGCGGSDDDNDGGSGSATRTVYAMANDAGTNRIAVFNLLDGAITPRGFVASGGPGSGPNPLPGAPGVGSDPLASQGSLTMSDDRSRLYAVNAGSGVGSGTISSFRIASNGDLTLVSTVPTGGANPVSFAVRGNRGYVVNVNGGGLNTAATISGISVASDGTLAPIPNSTRGLSAILARPSMVAIHGDYAVVTERATDKISAFRIASDGTLAAPVVSDAAAPGPFGVAFRGDTLVVSDVRPMTTGTGSASSYRFGSDGRATPVSPGVSNGQSASCWVTFSTDGEYAYVANTASDTISTYAVASDGSMTLLQAAASTTIPGSGAVDGGVTADGRYFIELYSNKGQIGVFTIGTDGALTLGQNLPAGILPPVGAQGLVVR